MQIKIFFQFHLFFTLYPMSLFLVFFNLQLHVSIYVVLRFIYDMELMCKAFFYDEIHYRYFCVVTFEWTDFKLSMNSGFFFCSIWYRSTECITWNSYVQHNGQTKFYFQFIKKSFKSLFIDIILLNYYMILLDFIHFLSKHHN
jgi:hypothetical protein